MIAETGVTEFQNVIPAEELPGVLRAYNKSLNHVFVSYIRQFL